MSESPTFPATGEEAKGKYFAFISYSHQDNRDRRAADAAQMPRRMRWADWLHNALETYRVPRSLVGTKNKRAAFIPERLVPCFRDEAELPTEARLQTAIEEALRQSRYLIVICSPRSAASIYVNAEVAFFKKLGRGDSILPLIVAGEPNAATSGAKYGFAPEEECFCPALKHPLHADGGLDESVDEEPICADARWGEARRELAAGERRMARHTLETALLKLIAGLLGIGFDDLVQRDRQRQIRVRRQRTALITAVMAIILALAAVAWWQRGRADAQRQRAEENARETRRQLAALYEERGREELLGGDPGKAAPYLAAAYRELPDRAPLRFLLGVCLRPLQGQVGTLEGHAASVKAVAWSPDGKRIATGDQSGVVKLWDAQSGRCLFTSETPRLNFLGISRLAFSPDSAWLAAGNTSSELLLLDAHAARALAGFRHGSAAIHDLAFNADGHLLVSASGGPSADGVKVWRMPAASEAASFGDREVFSARFSDDGKRLLTGAADGGVALWDWAEKRKTRDLHMEGPVSFAGFFAGEERIMATGPQTALSIWSVSDGAVLGSGKAEMGRQPVALEFSPDRRRVLLADSTSAKVVDIEAQPPGNVRELKVGSAVAILNGAHLSPDGSRVVTCPMDGRQGAVWDAGSGRLLAPLVGHTGHLLDAAFSPDGQRVVTVGSDRRGIIWNWPALVGPPPLPTHDFPVASARFGPEGEDWIVTATIDALRVFDRKSGRCLVTITHPKDEHVGGIAGGITWALSPDRRLAVTAQPDLTARIWDLGTGKPVHVLEHPDRVVAVAWSRDGRTLATGCWDHAVRLWDAATGQLRLQFPDYFKNARQLAFDATGTRLIVLDEKESGVWSTATGKKLWAFTGHTDQVTSAKFSPDGALIATASRDRTARLWRTGDGKELATLGPHAAQVQLIEFSPDGGVLATFGGSGQVFFWDTATGAALSPPWEQPTRLSANAIAFWPRGDFAAIAYSDEIDLVDFHTGSRQYHLQFPTRVNSVAFTPDGGTLLVGAGDTAGSPDCTAYLRPMLVPIGTPEEVAGEVERVSPWRLHEGRLVNDGH